MQHDQQRGFILPRFQFFQKPRGKRGLSGPNVPNDEGQSFHILRRVLEPRQRLGVLLRFKKKPIVDRDGEGTLFELKKFEKTHSRMVKKIVLHLLDPGRVETRLFPGFVLASLKDSTYKSTPRLFSHCGLAREQARLGAPGDGGCNVPF
jgi:hypothetical protein